MQRVPDCTFTTTYNRKNRVKQLAQRGHALTCQHVHDSPPFTSISPQVNLFRFNPFSSLSKFKEWHE